MWSKLASQPQAGSPGAPSSSLKVPVLDAPAESQDLQDKDELANHASDVHAADVDEHDHTEPPTARPYRKETIEMSTPLVKSPIRNDYMPATPPTSRRITPQKFVFLSDQKTVPTDLKRLQETTIKRRRDVISRMHDLDCQVAKLNSAHAEEIMDLNLAIRDTVDRAICHPLEASMERIVMERESSSVRGPALVEIERRMASIDKEMMHHIYVSMSDAKRDQLDDLQNELFQETIPIMRLEDRKSDKIEGGVIRRYENVAGIISRQFHQEAAARRARVELLKEQFEKTNANETRHEDGILQTIQDLRRKMRQEREQRIAEDKLILDDIIQTTMAMKRALLAAVGGSA